MRRLVLQSSTRLGRKPQKRPAGVRRHRAFIRAERTARKTTHGAANLGSPESNTPQHLRWFPRVVFARGRFARAQSPRRLLCPKAGTSSNSRSEPQQIAGWVYTDSWQEAIMERLRWK